MKYQIFAKNYDSYIWDVALYTDSILKALKVWIKAMKKYDVVEVRVIKRRYNRENQTSLYV